MKPEEARECFKSAIKDEKKGKKHKGLLIIPYNNKKAEEYITKAKMNLELCNFFKENEFDYKIPEEWFYTLYYCALAILSKFGIESRSQNCGCTSGQECRADGSCGSNGCLKLLYNGDPAQKLDVAIIGDQYSAGEMTKFASDANVFMNGLLSYEPFNSQRNKFNFYRIDNLKSLVCAYYERQLSCNMNAVELEASQCPADQVIVIVNNDIYGGGVGEILFRFAYSYRGDYKVAVHEFGHSFGRLQEEYPATPPIAYREEYDWTKRGYVRNCDSSPSCPL